MLTSSSLFFFRAPQVSFMIQKTPVKKFPRYLIMGENIIEKCLVFLDHRQIGDAREARGCSSRGCSNRGGSEGKGGQSEELGDWDWHT